MRSPAITALAALSLSGAQAAAVARDAIIIGFSAFRNADCSKPWSKSPIASPVLWTSQVISYEHAPSTCHTIPDAGAVVLTGAFPGCQLAVYTDSKCKTSPARPPLGWCVWNAAHFKAYIISCSGEQI